MISCSKICVKKISVIIPVYNAEDHLRQCLASALGQTLKGIEVICVNDGSTDGSAAILAEIAAKDDRVRVLTQANCGQGMARNRGLEIAQGEYVAFLDADDLYPDAETLADLVSAADRSGMDICGGGLEELLPNGAIRTAFDGPAAAFRFDRDGRVDFQEYAYDYGYYRFVYRLALLRRHGISFPGYRRFQDPPFMVRALSTAGSFYALTRSTYRYRVELRTVDWRGDGMVRAKGLLLGLADVAEQANALNLPKLLDVVLYQACEQYTAVILDGEIVKTCRDEVVALCRAFHVLDLAALLKLPYSNRTPLVFRRAKLLFRQKFRTMFRMCRFVSDAIWHGLPYAAGRFRGSAG